MGERGEVFSTKLIKNDRTYFFNVKENVYGDLYLNIVESRPTDVDGKFLRVLKRIPKDFGLCKTTRNKKRPR